MAKVVETMPERVGGTRRGRESKYNWGELLDGQIRELIKGEDFDCNPASMLSLAGIQARKLNLKLHAHIQGEGTLFLQAVPRPEGEAPRKGRTPVAAPEAPESVTEPAAVSAPDPTPVAAADPATSPPEAPVVDARSKVPAAFAK